MFVKKDIHITNNEGTRTMIKYNVYAVYFSPTGTSRTGATAIAKEIGDDVAEIDLTIRGNAPEKTDFDKGDIVVFGMPVYSGRLYTGAVARFSMLRGSNTPCIITVTYGNRHYDDALLEMREIAAAQGFVPFAGAALIGRHTYGEIQVGRPNSVDLSEDKAFARRAYKKLIDNGAELVSVPGRKPYRDGGSGGGFRPLTNANCIECRLCAANCPEGAIDSNDFSCIDNEKCIACFRCIRECPVDAKHMDDEAYNDFAAGFTQKLAARRENEYFM